jgi:mannose-6-phosphate isomerase-like protein (cupin superfamily)
VPARDHGTRAMPLLAQRASRSGRRPFRVRLAVDAGRAGANDGRMTTQPVNLPQALAGFAEIYSPRIVARVNDYDVRIAHTRGEHVWHVHEATDDFFLVLEGRFDIALWDGDGREHTVVLREGDTFVVPRRTEHKPSSPGGSILMFEPSATSTTGDRHEGDIPRHVDSTTGHEL